MLDFFLFSNKCFVNYINSNKKILKIAKKIQILHILKKQSYKFYIKFPAISPTVNSNHLMGQHFSNFLCFMIFFCIPRCLREFFCCCL